MRPLSALAAALLCAAATRSLRAQQPDAPSLATAVGGLRFRSIGPAVMGGRAHDVLALPDDPATLYVAAATGGIWRSRNKGTTWTPIFDAQGTSSMGALAAAPSDSRVLYAGTGEQENRQSSSWGDGVYRSDDGGDTWRHLGLAATRHIARVVVDPANPDVAYVAAVGNLWRPSADRGVYRTTDGGKSWTKVLYVDTLTGATDLVMDPTDPRTLYAATYQRLRKVWGFNGGGPGSGIWKSTDGGTTWRPLTNGIPAGDKGRIGLAIARTSPRRLYALVEHATQAGTYRTDDAGATWTRVSRTDPRPMYYSAIYVDPTAADRVWVLAEGISRSDDGGRTFRAMPNAPTYDVGLKSDHHAMWIDPRDSRHVYVVGDGGLHESWDMGITYLRINNFPIGQFYKIAVDMRSPYWIYGGLQDNHSWMGPSATRHWIGIVNEDWREIGFGDGMYQDLELPGSGIRDPGSVNGIGTTRAAGPSPASRVPSPGSAAPRYVYSESQDANITRVDANTGDMIDIQPRAPKGERPYRFDWTSPFVVAPPNGPAPSVLYLGGNRLFTSRDRGVSWTRSLDLTRRIDRDTLRLMGVLGRDIKLSKHDGESSFGEATTVAVSPRDPKVLWVGTDDGNLQLSRDGGATWTDVSANVPGLPAGSQPGVGAYPSRVAASAASPGSALVTFDAHRDGDFAPHVYRTTDFGRTWTRITDGLPEDGSARAIAEYPGRPDVLLLGTEHALFVSGDTGRTWGRWTSNLPTTRYDDIVLHPRDHDVVLGTHGRSIWILDDAQPLAEWSPAVAREPAHLFAIRPATIFQYWEDFSYRGQGAYAGENPAEGAIITYSLAGTAAAARLTIADAKGVVVRRLDVATGPSGQLLRASWDLRHEPPPQDPDTSAVTRDALPHPPHPITPRGPFVSPGTYTVTLEAGDARATRTLAVLPDPEMPLTLAQYREREAFLLDVAELQRQVWDLSRRAMALRRTRVARRDSAGPSAESTVLEDLRLRADSALALERRIALGRGGGAEGSGEPPLRTAIYGLAGDFNGSGVRGGSLYPPTTTQREYLARLKEELRAARTALEREERR